MAVTAMSISEGPYTDLTFPDRHVYATLGETPPPNSSGVRSTGQSSTLKRQAAVALGILCAILLTATITLSVLYTRQGVLEEAIAEQCDPNTSCLEGWKLFSCKCYYFSKRRRSWDNSYTYCRTDYGTLVVVNNQEEQEFINKHAIRGQYWIGLRETANRTFAWVDGSPLQQVFWRAGSPDVNRGIIPSRAVLTGPGEHLWVDVPIDSDAYFWICEALI